LTEKLRLIGEVLPPALHDNDVMADAIDPATAKAARLRRRYPHLARAQGRRAGRAGAGGRRARRLFRSHRADLAVSADGRLLALRVTSHKETPGLGDYIDPKKDRNKARPWITQFNGLGFDGVPREKWRVKKDGGRFDQMSGATISARAVTNASGRALAWATGKP
jgi:electron transport complex protein RnfG